MDFNVFDTVAVANRGTWLHLTSPIDGELLYLKKDDPNGGDMIDDKTKPCRVRVLGAEGRVAQEMVASERQKMQGDDAPDGQEMIKSQAMALLTGYENIDRGDRPAKAPDDNEWFCGLQKTLIRKGVYPSFAEQVRSHSMTRMHELGNVASG